MIARNIMITGCNRGLGFELVKQLAQSPSPPKNILACCRNPDVAEELRSFASENPSVKIFKLDVTDEDSFEDLKDKITKVIGDEGLNLLVNNAGAATKSTRIGRVTWAQMENSFKVNTIAPLMLTQKFLPLLKEAANQQKDQGFSVKRAAVVNMSSILASLAENENGGVYPYRASKAALNAITKSLSIDLKHNNILVTCFHPGWVKTEMGGENAPLTTTESISSIIKTLQQLSENHHGKFVNYDGTFLPW